MKFDFGIIETYWQYIIGGIPLILQLSLFSAFFGLTLGLLVLGMRHFSKVTKVIANVYVDIFRGTPVFVQLFLIYFGTMGLIPGFSFNKMVAAVIVFSLNSGAYLSEVLRAGLESIDKGQIEAAKALGVKNKDIVKDITIPLTFRKVFPAIVNEFITLVKETSVVSVLGLSDMMYRYKTVSSDTYSYFEPIVVVFIAYYILNKLLSVGGKYIERKLQYD